MKEGFLLVLPLLCGMIAGWGLKRAGILKDECQATLAALMFYVSSPCALFSLSAVLRASDFADVNFLIVHYGGYVVMLLIARAVALVRGRHIRQQAAAVLMSIRVNNIFMGLPAVLMLWGESWLPYFGRFMALSVAVYELLAAVSALTVLNGGVHWRTFRGLVVSMFRNPIILSILAGLVFGMGLGLEIPGWMDMTLKIMSQIGTGIALISLGMKLRLAQVARDFIDVWPDMLLRLIVAPALLWVGFRFLPTIPEMEKICILVTAMPVAMNSHPLAVSMGMDGDYSARAVTVSTVLSMVTIPLVIRFLL